MKKCFEKYEMFISISLIVIYIVSNSYCSNNFGITDYRTALLNIVLSLVIIIFILYNKLGRYYGITVIPKFRKYLYFIPLFLMMSVNLWNGININNTFLEIVFYIISMIGVGFLEEIIFRGFLFKMMAKDNLNRAIVVSSITFGIGHIINLLNGAMLIPTLIQICYAIAGGYLFVLVFYKSGSLWPCIITHIVINSLSIFNVDNIVSLYVVPIFLIVVSIWYARYLKKI